MEYCFSSKIKNLAYLYPISSLDTIIQSLQKDFIQSLITSPMIFCLPFLRNLSQETFLLIWLDLTQSFCCIIHTGEIYFSYTLKAFQNASEVPCETSHILQEPAHLYPIFNVKNISPKSIQIYVPLFNHQTPWLEVFCQNHFKITPQYIEHIPAPFQYDIIHHLSDPKYHFPLTNHSFSLKYVRSLSLSLLALLIMLIALPILELLQAYWYLHTKVPMKADQAYTQLPKQNIQFLIESIQKDYFPTEQIQVQDLYKMQYLQDLNAFYRYCTSISQALHTFAQYFLAQNNISMNELNLVYKSSFYQINCIIQSQEYQSILDFIASLKQTQTCKQIHITQSAFKEGYHITHISIAL